MEARSAPQREGRRSQHRTVSAGCTVRAMGLPIRLVEGSAGQRALRVVPLALLAIVALYVPLSTDVGFFPASIDKAYRIGQLNNLLAYAVAILGLDLVTGYTGQLSLGQSAFVGTGAYTTMILVTDHGWSYYAALPVVVVVCLIGGALIGLTAARISGMYLAVVTLCAAFVFPPLVLRLEWLTGGTNGKGPPRGSARMLPPSWMPFADAGRLAGPLWVYCVCLVITVVSFIAIRNLVHSAPGRAMVAVRDDTLGAIAFGIDAARTRVAAFAISAVYGGVAGAMLMMDRPFASEVQFGTELGIFLVVGLVVGGVGTMWGALSGAFVFLFLPVLVRQWTFDQGGLPPVLRQVSWPLFRVLRSAGGAAVGVFFGIALLVLMFAMPRGIVGAWRAVRRRIVVVDPSPRWMRDTAGEVNAGGRSPVDDT